MAYDIRSIQKRLNELGFGPLAEDGVKGPRTDAAVIAFKRSVGLNPRAYLGPITIAALMEPLPDSDIPWLAEALRVHGLHEQRDVSRLRQWFDRSVSHIDPREIPWCGAFEATIMRKWRPDIELPKNPLGAKQWAHFGNQCSPQLGCVMVFHRGSPSDWRGHVANYLGESTTAYYVIGGNQTNAVTKTWIVKKRFFMARWPLDYPEQRKQIRLSSDGRPLSSNEA